MSDYIDREELLKARFCVEEYNEKTGDWDLPVVAVDDIKAMPAADVAPVRNAEWNKNNDAIVCSFCGFGMFPIFAWSKGGEHSRATFYPRFCPDCGARMARMDEKSP